MRDLWRAIPVNRFSRAKRAERSPPLGRPRLPSSSDVRTRAFRSRSSSTRERGDLFVIRVAGNIVGPTVIGSIEFAAATLGTQLVVVLGHTQCGAIKTAIEELQKPTEDLSRSLQSIVDRIRPAIEGCVDDSDMKEEAMNIKALRANVRSSVRKLRENSPIISELVDRGSLHIVGAEYAILSGLVEFMDGVPLATHPRK